MLLPSIPHIIKFSKKPAQFMLEFTRAVRETDCLQSMLKTFELSRNLTRRHVYVLRGTDCLFFNPTGGFHSLTAASKQYFSERNHTPLVDASMRLPAAAGPSHQCSTAAGQLILDSE